MITENNRSRHCSVNSKHASTIFADTFLEVVGFERARRLHQIAALADKLTYLFTCYPLTELRGFATIQPQLFGRRRNSIQVRRMNIKAVIQVLCIRPVLALAASLFFS